MLFNINTRALRPVSKDAMFYIAHTILTTRQDIYRQESAPSGKRVERVLRFPNPEAFRNRPRSPLPLLSFLSHLMLQDKLDLML